MVKIYLVATLLVTLWFSSFCQSNQSYFPPKQSDREKKVKDLLPAVNQIYIEYAQEKKFPSLVYGILLDGKLIGWGQTGTIHDQLPADSSSMYHIASMSKSITAMSILQLRDAGKLKLDDPAARYIPELLSNKLLTSDAPQITIRHLLTHGAGFPEDNPWGDRQLADTKSELLNMIKKGTYFSNVPGVAYEYSNLGFALLGQIVEKVSGKSLEAYTKEKIFKPLGMNHTEWEYTKVPAEKLAHGYRINNEVYEEEPLLHHGSFGAMGGLITSIEDISKYVALHMSAWPPRSGPENSVIKRSSLREMHMPSNYSGLNGKFRYPSGRECAVVSAYNCGLGWLKDCEDRVYIGHSGGLPGFGSQWRFLPEYGIGVIAFANLTYAGLSTINLKVLDTIIRSANLKPYTIPVSDILNQRKNELVKLLPGWSENIDIHAEKIFAENFFMDQSSSIWKKTAATAFAQIGAIMKVTELRPVNQLRGDFDIIGDKGKLNIFFTLTPENPPLIQALQINTVK
ncbi:MAG: serine hydrolase domain-containing protein [Saprospiraceae bacterium]